MMTFILAFIANLQGLFVAAAIIGTLYIVICLLGYAMDFDKEQPLSAHTKTWFLKPVAFAVVAAALIATLPSINDLWRVRIALIKYELASPENIQKAAETIERIGSKLECKYLGCETEKENE